MGIPESFRRNGERALYGLTITAVFDAEGPIESEGMSVAPWIGGGTGGLALNADNNQNHPRPFAKGCK
jgi:hypothetical protein